MNTETEMTTSEQQLLEEAGNFIRQMYEEREPDLTGPEARMHEIRESVRKLGTYRLNSDELEFGARVAWRNSVRCIGRLFWKSLHVMDARSVRTADEVYQKLCEHLKFAWNGGAIRSVITVFPAVGANGYAPVKILNHQLFRYAGYRNDDGTVTGDPDSADFTQICRELGWKGNGTEFDLLPLVIKVRGEEPVYFEWPDELIHEVKIRHPEYPGIQKLNLKWYALPVISDMKLEIGGKVFPAAPFNGFYMGTEIGSRNFGDRHRYNKLEQVAEALKLSTAGRHSLWKDHALLALNEAVLHSFREDGVKITDHHTAAEQHRHFEELEACEGREVKGDWAWLNPPVASSATHVFHRSYDDKELKPNYFYKNTPGCPLGYSKN